VSKDRGWNQVKAEWRDVVLVCRKCAKKCDGGFGPDGDETFAKALRRSLDEGERRKVKTLRREVGVVEVGCLDICPKKAVVVVKGSEPGSMVLVPEGAGMAEVLERLGLTIGLGAEEVGAR
jgi:predicted metal-binding protein